MFTLVLLIADSRSPASPDVYIFYTCTCLRHTHVTLSYRNKTTEKQYSCQILLQNLHLCYHSGFWSVCHGHCTYSGHGNTCYGHCIYSGLLSSHSITCYGHCIYSGLISSHRNTCHGHCTYSGLISSHGSTCHGHSTYSGPNRNTRHGHITYSGPHLAMPQE